MRVTFCRLGLCVVFHHFNTSAKHIVNRLPTIFFGVLIVCSKDNNQKTL